MKQSTHKKLVEEFLTRKDYSLSKHSRKVYSWQAKDQNRALHEWTSLKRKHCILEQWEALNDAGFVRIKREYQTDWELDDMLGDCFNESNADTVPGGMRTLAAEKKAYISKLEQDGVYGIVGEYRITQCDDCNDECMYWNGCHNDTEKDCDDWEHADSCWGFEHDYAFDDNNDYLVGIMSETIKQLKEALRERNRCACCHQMITK